MPLLTNNMTSDKAYYDQDVSGSDIEYRKWMQEIEFYFNNYAEKLNNSLIGVSGKVAELGAGSCGLSACISRMPTVTQVFAIDISMVRMQKMIASSCEILGGDATKIMPIASDFNERLPFEDESLDLIVFDAALHHSRSMWHMLAECNRVLNKKGLLIAQREAYLSGIRAGRQLDRLLQTPEVLAKVSENMYLKEQYEYYLRANGFNPAFIRVAKNKLKSLLWFLNGTVFCDGVIWCNKC